ncbi:MAG: hypothetical protein WD512_08760, partial [Candidatus Paceibacterota bacterium]
YKEITDYIDLTVESFGQMPSGCGEPLYLSDYFFYISDLLERNKEISKERKVRILEFIKAHQTPNENPKTDLNILLGTYQKWLKIFPFEISYFTHLKERFEKQLPILNGKPEVNKYTGLAKVKMHTKSSLIEALINLTNELLIQINGVTLYEKGLITDANKIKLELIVNDRKLKLNEGYKNSSPDDEHRFRKMIKDWFNDEKKFIDEITPLLKALPPLRTETEAELKVKDKTPKKNKQLTLSEIWSDSKEAERHNEISLLIKNGYLKQNNDQTYEWLGKGWKKLAAITEIWKDKNFLKSNWQRFGNQRELCNAVCKHLGIAEKKIQSVYNTGFKESLISYDGELKEDMLKIKQEIILLL